MNRYSAQHTEIEEFGHKNLQIYQKQKALSGSFQCYIIAALCISHLTLQNTMVLITLE